ncbi:hypothetical protein ABZ468_36745 [Streptomyces sp. NPDC005708]|uniref:hypothetical protein n=2 Tax=Streptomyces TaxID=1883 RepID=UPI0033FE7474
MPAQTRTWGDQEFQADAPALAQQSDRGGDHRPVSEGDGGLWPAAFQDAELMAQHQDLGVFRRGGAGQQPQPAREQAAESVEQTYRHGIRACAEAALEAADVITS